MKKLIMFEYSKRYSGICIVFLVYFLVAVYKLPELPGEWYGDISNLHEYVVDIQQEKWPIAFRQGVGPLAHYLYVPFLPLTGQRYIGYKILSVLSGAFSLFGIYFFTKNIFDKRTAFITTAVASVSFWFLAWARLGNVLGILPGFVAFAFSFLFLYQKNKKPYYLMIGIVCAGASMFVYLGGLMVLVAFFVTYVATQKKNTLLNS